MPHSSWLEYLERSKWGCQTILVNTKLFLHWNSVTEESCGTEMMHNAKKHVVDYSSACGVAHRSTTRAALRISTRETCRCQNVERNHHLCQTSKWRLSRGHSWCSSISLYAQGLGGKLPMGEGIDDQQWNGRHWYCAECFSLSASLSLKHTFSL